MQRSAIIGGDATFRRDDVRYIMELHRDGTSRTYEVSQTIGSRFFQYYVGRMVQGPEPSFSQLRTAEHVLPFGYWIEEREWVPVVHIDEERPEGQRLDPFDGVSITENLRQYSTQCNFCHTTFTLGDMMVRSTRSIGRHAPTEMHLLTSAFLDEDHPELWDGDRSASAIDDQEMMAIMRRMITMEAPDHAVTLGVSCEACHLGSRDHAEGGARKPAFFPMAPEFHVAGEFETGRTRENVNWVCGRCHTGHRPEFCGRNDHLELDGIRRHDERRVCIRIDVHQMPRTAFSDRHNLVADSGRGRSVLSELS